MKPLFIVDIDGTVCDSADFVSRLSVRFKTHVDFWTDEQVKLFMEEVSRRHVLPGAEVLKTMVLQGFCDVVFLTGRSEKIGKSRNLGRRLTTGWLCEKLGMPKDIPLFMRPPGDQRTPSTIKLDVFEHMVLPKYRKRSFVFLDDDTKALAVYAKHGLALKSPECWAALAHFLPE